MKKIIAFISKMKNKNYQSIVLQESFILALL